MQPNSDVQIGQVRFEEEMEQALPIDAEEFCAWMEHAGTNDGGYTIGSRLLTLLGAEEVESDVFEPWNVLRAMVADVCGSALQRAARNIDVQTVALLLHAHGAMDLGVPPSAEMENVRRTLGESNEEQWTNDYQMLHCELANVREEQGKDEPLISAGALTQDGPGEDVGTRSGALDDAAKSVKACAEAGMWDMEASAAEGGDSGSSRKVKFPRVDPPEVEDEPGQAVKEDTPGYIARAFPKLFPHGVGDFHSPRGDGEKALKFEEWGRMLMMWHDGRFMRHTRFRYWLLDTSLRLMTPGM